MNAEFPRETPPIIVGAPAKTEGLAMYNSFYPFAGTDRRRDGGGEDEYSGGIIIKEDPNYDVPTHPEEIIPGQTQH